MCVCVCVCVVNEMQQKKKGHLLLPRFFGSLIAFQTETTAIEDSIIITKRTVLHLTKKWLTQLSDLNSKKERKTMIGQVPFHFAISFF